MLKILIIALITCMISGCGNKPDLTMRHYKVTNHFSVSSYGLTIFNAHFVGLKKKKESLILNTGNIRYDASNTTHAWLDIHEYANGMYGVIAHLPASYRDAAVINFKKETPGTDSFITVLK